MGIGIDDLVVIGIIVVYQVEHLLRIVLLAIISILLLLFIIFLLRISNKFLSN